MTIARRWLVLLAPLLCGCPATTEPPVENPGTAAGGINLEVQAKSGRATLLAGVDSPADKKLIMKELSQQLGVQCDYCHDVADFTAPSPNKTIANYMFAHYSSAFTTKTGGVVTCNACHQGSAKPVGDRADKKRVSAFMKEKMQDPFTKKGGAAVECATCHGDKLDAPFLPR
jgi:hypothetical protein